MADVNLEIYLLLRSAQKYDIPEMLKWPIIIFNTYLISVLQNWEITGHLWPVTCDLWRVTCDVWPQR